MFAFFSANVIKVKCKSCLTILSKTTKTSTSTLTHQRQRSSAVLIVFVFVVVRKYFPAAWTLAKSFCCCVFFFFCFLIVMEICIVFLKELESFTIEKKNQKQNTNCNYITLICCLLWCFEECEILCSKLFIA